MAAGLVLRGPIVEEHGIRLPLLVDGPVELGREIIAPAALEPKLRIGIDPVELAEAGDGGCPAVRPRDAEGADAEFHPGLFLVHGAVNLFVGSMFELAVERNAVDQVGTVRREAAGQRGQALDVVAPVAVQLAGDAILTQVKSIGDQVAIGSVVSVAARVSPAASLVRSICTSSPSSAVGKRP